MTAARTADSTPASEPRNSGVTQANTQRAP